MTADIKSYLIAQGITTTIYDGTLPTSPNECVALYQYGGQTPLYIADLKRPSLQVRSRAETSRQALSNLEAIADILSQIGDETNETVNEGVTIDGTLYLRIQPIQEATHLGQDDNDRYEFVQNFYVTKE